MLSSKINSNKNVNALLCPGKDENSKKAVELPFLHLKVLSIIFRR